MNYELAKQLKEAGFPQKIEETIAESGYMAFTKDRTQIIFDDGFWRNGEPEIYIPTLSELIEVCGNDLIDLTRIVDGWAANYEAGDTCEAPTPEEAVAKLWLELNK